MPRAYESCLACQQITSLDTTKRWKFELDITLTDNGSHATMIRSELAEKCSKIDNDTKAKQYKF